MRNLVRCICCRNPDKSTDGNSTYATVLCAFEQKSIQTMFKKEGAVNAYGIEWYDETANANLANFSGGVNNKNGYSNYFGSLITGDGSTLWNTYVNESALRYGLDGQPNGNIYSSLANTSGAYACMQRNRDLDGDGTIDDNEKRWYLASSDQYVQMWIGETAIDPYARMSGIITATTENEYKALSHYYTSSDNARRIYWASEAGSVGAYGYNPGGNTWMGQYHKARCVRTLTSYNAEPATVYTKSGNQITMNHLQEGAYRQSGAMVGEYGEHNELDAMRNQIPYSIEVAESDFNGEMIFESSASTVESAFFVRTDSDGWGGCTATAGENPATDVVLTFTNSWSKMAIFPESIKELTAGTSVTITFDSFTATIGGVDVTSKLSRTGFCSEVSPWPHYTTTNCSVVLGTFGGSNDYLSISNQTGIGFNVLANPTGYTISEDTPLVITIKNLQVNGVNPILGSVTSTFSGNYLTKMVASRDVCATLGDGWRVPNERELQVMGLEGFLGNESSGVYYLARTTFSAYPNVGAKRYIFAWQKGAQRLETVCYFYG